MGSPSSEKLSLKNCATSTLVHPTVVYTPAAVRRSHGLAGIHGAEPDCGNIEKHHVSNGNEKIGTKSKRCTSMDTGLVKELV